MVKPLLSLPTLLLWLPLMSLLLSSFASAVSSDTPTDGEALILFRSWILEDPNQVLSNWQINWNTCSWFGVSCMNGRVTKLNLSGCNLSGGITLYPLASLHMLSTLDLSTNAFFINSTSLLQLPRALNQLDLSSAGLAGFMPEDFLPTHPNLVRLNLSRSNLTGSLPQLEIENLQVLDLSFNNLSGDITDPKLGSSCKNLTHMDLSGNRLAIGVHTSICNCTNLKTLNLSSNELVGEIPQGFSELRSLERLDLSRNRLVGLIPLGLGNACGSLLEFRFSNNILSGSIPDSFSTCSSLRLLDLSNNNMSGPLPSDLFQNLVSLEMLLLSDNFISGAIPSSISACKSLKVIDFSSNKFAGAIPPNLCSSESSLEELRIPDNSIRGEIPPQLWYCTNLKTIDLSINYLEGSIPPELGKIQNLEHLMCWFNGLHGRIPRELGQCRRLKTLILNNNLLSGDIPKELFNHTNLEWMSLTSNRITGKIPRELGSLSRLAVLQLGNNSLSGEIPMELGNCSSLMWLDLNSNSLTGELPLRLGRQLGAKALSGILSGNTLAFVRNVGNSCKGVGGLLEFAGIRAERLMQVPTLKTCDFTRLYSGAALSDWTHYQTLEYLDLSYNELNGSIPEEFGDMAVLQVLDLAHNKLSGEIPSSLGRLRNLGVFDASHNGLRGSIPDSFSNLSFLVQIDLSDNGLSGEIPSRGQLSTLPASQYANNPGLCGVPLPPCQASNTLQAEESTPEHRARSSWNNIVVGILASGAMIVVVVWAMVRRVRNKRAEAAKMLGRLHSSDAPTTWKIDKEREPLSINVATFQRPLRRLKFSQLVEATNGFSTGSLIGSGGFGDVFKATLRDGTSVAIKKLIHLSYQGEREFTAEMETLGKIRHDNLVPLLGYCKVGEERLLVYEFMSSGSLEAAIHSNLVSLSWGERKRATRGAARGLCFLHHGCFPRVIHRDVKSSNVLLDGGMKGRVSDFGMARLVSAADTHLSVSTLAGTPGYVPPEYYQSFRCTARGDVYSFGVVMLEVVTGRRPTGREDDFGETNLVGWAKGMVADGKGREIVDKGLINADEGEVMKFLEVAMKCVEDLPSRRPTMLQVVAMLKDLTSEGGDTTADK